MNLNSKYKSKILEEVYNQKNKLLQMAEETGLEFIKNLEEHEECLKAAGSNLYILYFTAEWCPPCKKIKPKLIEMQKEYENMLFRQVDADEGEEVFQEFMPTAMPTFRFHKDGKHLEDEDVKGASEAKVKAVLEKYK